MISLFDRAWDELASKSRCDARGSAEYKRVLAKWKSSGFRLALCMFILTEANREPPPRPQDDAEKVGGK